MATPKRIKARLAHLRRELRAERISYGELSELQDLVPYIEPGDLELLEAAGVPEEQALGKKKACSNPAWTKQHFELVAQVFAGLRAEAKRRKADPLAYSVLDRSIEQFDAEFRVRNPRFDSLKFKMAAAYLVAP